MMAKNRSTFPVEERRRSRAPVRASGNFNPRSPRGERPPGNFGNSRSRRSFNAGIQPYGSLPPRGTRIETNIQPRTFAGILSLLPRGAWIKIKRLGNHVYVPSCRSPTGSDPTMPAIPLRYPRFNPCSSCMSDLVARNIVADNLILIYASAQRMVHGLRKRRPCGTISIPRTPPLDSGSFIFQSTPFIAEDDGVELCRAIPSRAPAGRCPREACEFPLSLVTEARCPTVDRARPTSRAFCRSSAAAEPCAAPLRSRRPAPRSRDSARSVPAGLPVRGAPF